MATKDLLEQLALTQPRQALLRTKLDELVYSDLAAELMYCGFVSRKCATGRHPELVDVPHILVLEFECDENLASQPLKTQFQLMNGRLLPTEEYLQEKLSPLNGMVVPAARRKSLETQLRAQLAVDSTSPSDRPIPEVRGYHGVDCMTRIEARWKGEPFVVSLREDTAYLGLLESGVGPPELMNSVFEEGWAEYLRRSLKIPKVRSFKDVWYGRIDEVKAEQVEWAAKRGGLPKEMQVGSDGVAMAREMRRMGPSGGFGQSNILLFCRGSVHPSELVLTTSDS